MTDKNVSSNSTASASALNWLTIGAATGLTTLAGSLVALRRLIPQRLFDLPPSTHSTVTQRAVTIEAADGTPLVHDAILAKSDTPLPTILIRTPYGRTLKSFEGLGKQLIGKQYAQRGYNFVIQDCRGTGDSGGEFEAYVNEADDGRDTVEWIARQPWSDGKVGMMGQSYVGYVQWAAAASGTPHLQALAPTITRARLGGFPDHAYPLDLALRWLLFMDAFEAKDIGRWEQLRRVGSASSQNKLLAAGFDTLPIAETPQAVFGRSNRIFDAWLAHSDPTDPYWDTIDHRDIVPTAPPAYMVAGWHDLFLDGQLADFTLQHDAGRQPFLTVGPWTHIDFANQSTVVGETLRWFDQHLKGAAPIRDCAGRLYVMGADEWRDFPTWPPPSEPLVYHLTGNGSENGALQKVATKPTNQPSQYTYDPADPTPNIAGKLISSEAGSADNREVEARDDVLTFTTAPLLEDVDIIGAVKATVYFASSADSVDIFARLCDVQPDGSSLNVCDDLIRVASPDGSQPIEVPMSSTAYRFVAGNRIRLQLSSGAHPRFARNLGTGEEWMFGTEMVSAENTLFHDAEHPSTLTLPRVG